jgi:acyl-CoA thioester hydrolase
MNYSYSSMVFFDELDPMQVLHNSRFATHVERAVTSYYATSGRAWETDPANNPDQFHVVRELRIEFLNPVVGPGPIRIDIWVERLGNTSCKYGFLCSSDDGRVPYARGERTIVKVDPSTRRPAPWTDFFRDHNAALLKVSADSVRTSGNAERAASREE